MLNATTTACWRKWSICASRKVLHVQNSGTQCALVHNTICRLNLCVIVFVQLTKNMPQNCCVPGCPKAIGGHLFPRDPVLRQQWIVAVRRVDPNNAGKLWQPSQYSAVCHHHFVSSDYMDTILGEQMLLIFLYFIYNY